MGGCVHGVVCRTIQPSESWRGTFGAGAGRPPAEPEAMGGPPLIRRLTESQYRATIADIFGPGITSKVIPASLSFPRIKLISGNNRRGESEVFQLLGRNLGPGMKNRLTHCEGAGRLCHRLGRHRFGPVTGSWRLRPVEVWASAGLVYSK